MKLKNKLFLSIGLALASNSVFAYSYDEQKFIETQNKAYSGDADAMIDLGMAYDPECTDNYSDKFSETSCSFGAYDSHLTNQPKDIYKALYWYMRAINQTDDEYKKRTPIRRIARFYLEGKQLSRDVNKALFWYKKVVSQNSEVMKKLAELYIDEKYIPKNTEQALYWYKKYYELCIKESYEAHVIAKKIADVYLKQGDIDFAIEWYDKGEDITEIMKILRENKRYTEALEYATKYSNKWDIYVELQLMQLLISQEISSQIDFNDISKKAEQGDLHSQELLAAMYLLGEYVEKDKEKGVFWLKKAYETTESNVIVEWVKRLFNEKNEDKPKLLYWLGNYADDGMKYRKLLEENSQYKDTIYYGSNLHSIGYAYYYGKNVVQDKELAKKYYRLACDNGYKKSCDVYNDILKEEKDSQKAK